MTTTGSRLDELPTRNGFRMRGLEMTRIETFTDAAFAFAVTLLVVSIDRIPTNYGELAAAVRDVPAFAFSFMLLMMFWHGHWSWSRRYGLEDNPTVVLSCLLVFTTLCYVYPLKFLLSLWIGWMTGTSQGAIQSGAQLYSIFVIYGVGFVALSLVITTLYVHAYRKRSELGLNVLELFDTRADIAGWLIVAGTGVVSIVLALTTAPSVWALPGWVYMALPVLSPIHGVAAGRRRRRIAAAMAEGSA